MKRGTLRSRYPPCRQKTRQLRACRGVLAHSFVCQPPDVCSVGGAQACLIQGRQARRCYVLPSISCCRSAYRSSRRERPRRWTGNTSLLTSLRIFVMHRMDNGRLLHADPVPPPLEHLLVVIQRVVQILVASRLDGMLSGIFFSRARSSLSFRGPLRSPCYSTSAPGADDRRTLRAMIVPTSCLHLFCPHLTIYLYRRCTHIFGSLQLDLDPTIPSAVDKTSPRVEKTTPVRSDETNPHKLVR